MTEFTTDPAYREFLRPLSDDEFSDLEADCLKNGIRDPVIIWNGVLIDGHNRTTIAKMHNLPFKTVEMQFKSKEDAIYYIAMNQISRRNLDEIDRVLMAIALKPIYAKLGKERMIERGRNSHKFVRTDKLDGTSVIGDPEKSFNRIDTRKELAKIAGVTPTRFGMYETVFANDMSAVGRLRSGETKLSEEYAKIDKKAKIQEDIQKAFETEVRLKGLEIGMTFRDDTTYAESGLKTRAVINMYNPALQMLEKIVARDSLYYLLVSTSKDIYDIPNVVSKQMHYNGIVVLNVGTDEVKFLHVFGPPVDLPAIVMSPTLDDAIAGAIHGFVKPGDVVANPFPMDGKIAYAMKRLDTIGTVFTHDKIRAKEIVDYIKTKEV